MEQEIKDGLQYTLYQAENFAMVQLSNQSYGYSTKSTYSLDLDSFDCWVTLPAGGTDFWNYRVSLRTDVAIGQHKATGEQTQIWVLLEVLNETIVVTGTTYWKARYKRGEFNYPPVDTTVPTVILSVWLQNIAGYQAPITFSIPFSVTFTIKYP